MIFYYIFEFSLTFLSSVVSSSPGDRRRQNDSHWQPRYSNPIFTNPYFDERIRIPEDTAIRRAKHERDLEGNNSCSWSGDDRSEFSAAGIE